MAHVFEKKWRSQDVRLQENVDFTALLLSKRVLDGLKHAGFKKPSPIQLEAVPLGRFGHDLIVQAKSGTGKTLVFVIVALEMLKRKLFRPQVLVVVPTREIATQICSVFKIVGSTFPKLICSSFIGGLPLFEDKEKAVMSQIVVGTPGRLKQLIELKSLPTNSIRLLVFDEADQLLESGSFKDDLEDIFSALPDEKQIIATSATYSPKVKKQLSRYLTNFQMVRLNAKELALLGMVHYAKIVDYCPIPVILYKSKLLVLENILKTVKFAQCLLFCNGIQRVEVLYKDVKRCGFSTAYISSAKEQCDRLKAIDRLRRFKCKVLVSSDLTSRGIDAENVDLVINFDLALSTEVYMHRVGRAGRYGSIGVAISIIDNREMKYLEKIEKAGSFKSYKLPDLIPKDLILYPPEADFVIDESDSENVNCSEVIKPVNSHVKYGDNSHHDSQKDIDKTNMQVIGVSETNVYTDDNAISDLAIQSIPNDIKYHGGITKHTAKCEVKVEKGDINDILYLKNKSIKIIHSDEETAEKKFENGYFSNNIKDKTKDLYLLNDCDQSKLIDSEFADKSHASDIHESPSDFCDSNRIKKQDIMNDNIDNDAQLNNQSCNANNNVEKKDYETDDKKLNEIDIDNVPVSSETKDIVKNKEAESENCEPENILKSSDALNNIIKSFVDTYESNKVVECTKVTFDYDSHLNENFDKKFITKDMINNLKSERNEFFYKTFKNFQESKDEFSTATKSRKEKEVTKINEDNIIPSKDEDISNSGLVREEVNITHAKLVENSEFEKREIFSEKPNFESTPQFIDKIKPENLKITESEAASKPTIQNKLIQMFQEFSEELDSDDSDSSEVAKSNSSALQSLSRDSDSSSSDFESYSLSNDSEKDFSETYSDSSSSCFVSSVDKDDENIYHHNYDRTGRQNPSLISDSSRNQMHHEKVHAKYFQNQKCSCCCATMHCMPLKSRIRSAEPCRMIRGRRHGAFNPNAFVSSSHFGNSCYFRRAFPAAASRREQRCADLNVIQSYFPRSHARFHRSRNLSRNAIREEVQSRGEHPACRRARHCHTLNCFLPTDHRCHPNTPDYPCEQGPTCEMWYKTFYNQWLHIQRVINN